MTEQSAEYKLTKNLIVEEIKVVFAELRRLAIETGVTGEFTNGFLAGLDAAEKGIIAWARDRDSVERKQ